MWSTSAGTENSNSYVDKAKAMAMRKGMEYMLDSMTAGNGAASSNSFAEKAKTMAMKKGREYMLNNMNLNPTSNDNFNQPRKSSSFMDRVPSMAFVPGHGILIRNRK